MTTPEQLDEAFRRAYAADRIGRAWMVPSKDYAGGYHRGLDVREVHPSGNYSVVTDVIAISNGVVDYIGRPNTLLGPTIRIKRDEGGYEFHSHSIATATTGTRTTAGTRLGRNARMNEKPGQVGGVHDHIVVSDHADGAWNTSRPTRDPLPIIRAVLAEPAGDGGSRPLTATKQGDADMRVVLWKPDPDQDGTVLAFGPGQVRVFGPGELVQAARARDVTGRDETTTSKFYEVGNDGLGGLCEAYGVPFNEGVMAAMNGDAWQINGKPGGRFWSRDLARAAT